MGTQKDLNRFLNAAEGTSDEKVVNELITRAQVQAKYNASDSMHFGLGLQHYCHFTSPIRRYSDLLVHRVLISRFDLGAGGASPATLDLTAEHVSATERKAELAERDAKERYLAEYLSDKVGQAFDAIIVQVKEAGLLMRLQETHAYAYLPKQSLRDLFPGARSFSNRSQHTLQIGSECFRVGMQKRVVLTEVDRLKSRILCNLDLET